MKEDFVHYMWKHMLIRNQNISTTDGSSIEVISPGIENHDAGPDFTAARVRIDGTLWAGNVELHVKSSYWYDHGHHKDEAYDNIILHVVYHADKEVVKPNGSPIPHLEIKNYCDPQLENRYLSLMRSKNSIPCEKLLDKVDDFTFRHWLCRLLVCRMERKADDAIRFLQYFGNDWEQLSLFLLARYLGGKANASTFGLLIQRTPFEALMKNHDDLITLEALLFGQAGLLEKSFQEPYPMKLKNEYHYLGKKYDLPERLHKRLWKYSRMRPANFPDMRIAQLAAMIHVNQGRLFSKVLTMNAQDNICDVMRAEVNTYWNRHYRLDSKSRHNIKKMGVATLHNILINVLAPLFFIYGKERNKASFVEHGLDLMAKIPGEQNRITSTWKALGREPANAGESQGMIELFKQYCLARKCLKCSIGHQILKKTKS